MQKITHFSLFKPLKASLLKMSIEREKNMYKQIENWNASNIDRFHRNVTGTLCERNLCTNLIEMRERMGCLILNERSHSN